MSGQVLGIPVIVKRARKRHSCWWCDESIDPGQPYTYWTWADEGLTRIKCHPECRDAWDETCSRYGEVYETNPHEHDRGEPA